MLLRSPLVHDVPAMAALINKFADEGLMLPRSQYNIYQCIRDFCVVIMDGKLVACGALHIVWNDLAEIRSLAVDKDYQNLGVGRKLVTTLLDEAKELGLPGVFTLTYQEKFFAKYGFYVVPHERLPHKIWGACLDCPKFPDCDEIAMILDFE